MTMLKLMNALVVVLVLVLVCGTTGAAEQHEFCVIGAGPAGLQVGQFMLSRGWDYTILERNTIPVRTGSQIRIGFLLVKDAL